MYPVLIKIGPIEIYSYLFFIVLGAFFAYLIGKKRAAELGISQEIFLRLFFWSLVSALGGARVTSLLINWGQFQKAPFELFFSPAGFVFYGGLASTLVCIFFAAKKYKIKFLKATDLFALLAPLAHSFGRLGCFLNGCCYGITTQSWLGIKFPPGSQAGAFKTEIIPTQLISAFFLFTLFLFLFILRNKIKTIGKITGIYLLFYSLFRLSIEFYRAEPRIFFLFLPVAQWISLVVFFIAVTLLKKNE